MRRFILFVCVLAVCVFAQEQDKKVEISAEALAKLMDKLDKLEEEIAEQKKQIAELKKDLQSFKENSKEEMVSIEPVAIYSFNGNPNKPHGNAVPNECQLPSSIPDNAKKLLFFVTMYSGSTSTAQRTIKFSTKEDKKEYISFFYSYHYNQPAVNSSSENFNLLYTSERKVYITLHQGDIPSDRNVLTTLYVVGYIK